MSQKKILIMLSIVVLGSILLFVLSMIGSRVLTSFIGQPKQFSADVDNNGVIDARDLEGYIELYQQQDLRADTDGNNLVEPYDLTQFSILYRSSQ